MNQNAQISARVIIRFVFVLIIVVCISWSVVMYYQWKNSFVNVDSTSHSKSTTRILTDLAGVYGQPTADRIVKDYKKLTGESASLAVVRASSFDGTKADSSFLIDSSTSDATYKVTLKDGTVAIDCPDISEQQSTNWVCPSDESEDGE